MREEGSKSGSTSPRHRGFLATAAILAALAGPLGVAEAASAPAAEVPPVSAEITVTLLQTEVRVEDRKGAFLSGLALPDFELFEDGQKVEIQYVDEVGASGPAAPTPAPGVPRTTVVAPNPPSRGPRPGASLTVVLDRANSAQESLSRQKVFLRQFLKQVPAATLVGVFELKPDGVFEMRGNYTRSAEAAAAAVDCIGAGGGGGTDRASKNREIERTMQDRLQLCGSMSGDQADTCQEASFEQVILFARTAAQEERRRAESSMTSLRTILHFSDHLPGTRSLLLVSEGIDPGGVSYFDTAAKLIQFQSQTSGVRGTQRFITEVQHEAAAFAVDVPAFRDMIAAATDSSVTVNWVNPAHETSISPVSPESRVGTYSAGATFVDAASPVDLMRGLAESTGGSALLRAAGMDGFYTKVARDLRQYYVLSYTPARKHHDGEKHRIEVKVARKDARVRLRDSYTDLLPEVRNGRALAAVLDFPEVASQIDLGARINYLRQPAGEYDIRVLLSIPYSAIQPALREGRSEDVLALGFVLRKESGEVVQALNPELQVREPAARFDELAKAGARIEYRQRLEAPAGRYTLTAAVLDTIASTTGARRFELELPAPGARCGTSTPLFLAAETTVTADRVDGIAFDERGDARHADQKLTFAASVDLPAAGKLNGLYQILDAAPGPSGAPAVEIAFRLLRGKAFLNQTPPSRIERYTDPGARTIASFFSVPYSALAPGDYRLELMIRDAVAGCSSLAGADFRVVQSAGSASSP